MEEEKIIEKANELFMWMAKKVSEMEINYGKEFVKHVIYTNNFEMLQKMMNGEILETK